MPETEPRESTHEGKEPVASFYVGDWHVDPTTARIQRERKVVKLEPRVMQVLVYLAQRPGIVVSRQELAANVWSGSVVGYDALGRAIAQMRKAFEDDPQDPRYIETLSKRGYRLIAPVTGVKSDAAPDPSGTRTTKPAAKRWIPYTTIIVIGIFLFIAAYWLSGRFTSTDPGTTSVVVLPFANPSGDKEIAYIANGITDDLISELTQVPGLLVIARESSFRYKGKTIDPKSIAKELNVRYLLGGNIRQDGSALRINTHLTDSKTSAEVWAQRFDVASNTLLAVQDQIIDRVVHALALELSPQKRKSISLAQAQTEDLAAYRLFLEARDRFFQNTKTETQTARVLLERAIKRDASFAAAYTYLAWTYVFDTMNGWSEQRDHSLNQALELSNKALAIQKDFPLAYFVRGLVYREQREFIKALVEAERAIELDPNYANGHVLLATLLYYAERPKEGLQRMKKAIRLNPLHSHNYPFHLGQAYFLLKDYENATEAFRAGLKVNPTSERIRIWLAASYAQNDRIDDAKWEVEQALITNPSLSSKKIANAFPFINLADMQPLLDGLHRAGMPD